MDSLNFVVKPALANGKLALVEITDLSTGETSTWTTTGWNGSMEVTPGPQNLQIKAIIWNTANTSGNVTCIISITNDFLMARVTQHLAPGASFSVINVWDMQTQDVTVTITVNDTV